MFQKFLFSCFLAILSFTSLYASGQHGKVPKVAETIAYKVDTVHSTVEFLVSHMVVSRTRGYFDQFDGAVELDAKGQLKSLSGEVKVGSLSTRNQKRDKHLLSPDFFDAGKYPNMTLSTRKVHNMGGGKVRVVGDLTIRSQTKPVEFTGVLRKAIKDPWGNTRAGLTLETVINRLDFGMKWSKVMDAGGLVVGNDVTISLELEIIEKK